MSVYRITRAQIKDSKQARIAAPLFARLEAVAQHRGFSITAQLAMILERGLVAEERKIAREKSEG